MDINSSITNTILTAKNSSIINKFYFEIHSQCVKISQKLFKIKNYKVLKDQINVSESKLPKISYLNSDIL